MAKQTYETYYKDYFNTRCKRINLVLDKEKDADIIKALDGKNLVKEIYVPNKIVNLVVK